MDFTREPIIETVITPKEGYKIVVRSSKNPGSEEYFVDAVEVVTFGGSSFFRSLERPKAFLVPSSDYEILEVREARIVLKNVGLERSIKIAGGKENAPKPREPRQEAPPREERQETSQPVPSSDNKEIKEGERGGRDGRRRDRRRQGRRRGRGDEETTAQEVHPAIQEEPRVELNPPNPDAREAAGESAPMMAQSILNSLLTPPPTLISETLKSYKDNALFKEAFYTKEEIETAKEGEVSGETFAQDDVVIEQPEFGSFETTVETDEEIYRQRQKEGSENLSNQETSTETEKL